MLVNLMSMSVKHKLYDNYRADVKLYGCVHLPDDEYHLKRSTGKFTFAVLITVLQIKYASARNLSLR